MTCLYSLYDALVSINVPGDRARAVVDAMEHDMISQLASKSDLDGLRRELHSEFALVRQESKADVALLRQEIESGLSSLRKDLTIWLGSAQILGMGLLFAGLKLT